jgi:hypothetical protein
MRSAPMSKNKEYEMISTFLFFRVELPLAFDCVFTPGAPVFVVLRILIARILGRIALRAPLL